MRERIARTGGGEQKREGDGFYSHSRACMFNEDASTIPKGHNAFQSRAA
jgi:hypothetical protein